MNVRKWLRRLIPLSWRRAWRWHGRQWTDWRQGLRERTVTPHGLRVHYPPRLTLQQPLLPGPTAQAKHQNLALASIALSGLEIAPGQLLSFWQVVGAPVAKRGFQPGRNIVDGRLALDYGGGLCQLSSALYELALRGGMTVHERHPHSVNVYTPATTYTPLGLDATVAYGYKDLRLENPFSFPLAFAIHLTADTLVVQLCAPQPVHELTLRVEHRQPAPNLLQADVFYAHTDQADRLLSTHIYPSSPPE